MLPGFRALSAPAEAPSTLRSRYLAELEGKLLKAIFA
jgi:hypothetical protein